jgi:phosphohistidine phosphatase
MAEALNERGWWPDVVFSSDSERTRETWAGMCASIDRATDTFFLNDLYLGGIDEIRDAVLEARLRSSTALVLGHNPGWEDAAGWLCGQDISMTTANCVLLMREAESWERALAQPGSWELVAHLRPRDLVEG